LYRFLPPRLATFAFLLRTPPPPLVSSTPVSGGLEKFNIFFVSLLYRFSRLSLTLAGIASSLGSLLLGHPRFPCRLTPGRVDPPRRSFSRGRTQNRSGYSFPPPGRYLCSLEVYRTSKLLLPAGLQGKYSNLCPPPNPIGRPPYS